MARFSGHVGLRTDPVEVEPGIYDEGIEDRPITGDILLKPTRWSGGELSQDSVRANHEVSFIIPETTLSDFAEVVYVVWQNRKWSVTAIQYMRPRLKLTLGGLYNG